MNPNQILTVLFCITLNASEKLWFSEVFKGVKTLGIKQTLHNYQYDSLFYQVLHKLHEGYFFDISTLFTRTDFLTTNSEILLYKSSYILHSYYYRVDASIYQCCSHYLPLLTRYYMFSIKIAHKAQHKLLYYILNSR